MLSSSARMRTCATVLVIVQRELDSALIRLGRRRYARPVHAGSWREDRGMIEAQLFNGTILQFPDGTPDHTPLKTYNVSGILRAQIGGRGGRHTKVRRGSPPSKNTIENLTKSALSVFQRSPKFATIRVARWGKCWGSAAWHGRRNGSRRDPSRP